jgi:hypothetical protein
VRAVEQAPDGFMVKVGETVRSLDQNSALWPLLAQFSKQLKWPVNGERIQLEPEEWKDILTAAFRNEQHRIAQGLNGGMVILGMRTSRMRKTEFSQFLEFVNATAVDRGVNLKPEAEAS